MFKSISTTFKSMSKMFEDMDKNFEELDKEIEAMSKEAESSSSSFDEKVTIVKETKADGTTVITKTITKGSKKAEKK
jgi:hypothetical protein